MTRGSGVIPSSDSKIPTELASVVEQLSLLCSQLQVEGGSQDPNDGDKTLEGLLLQLKEHLQKRGAKKRESWGRLGHPETDHTSQHQPEFLSNAPVPSKPHSAGRGAQGKGRRRRQRWKGTGRHPPGVLIVRPQIKSVRRQEVAMKNEASSTPGYSQPTFSSTQHQSPRKHCPVSPTRKPASLSHPHSPPQPHASSSYRSSKWPTGHSQPTSSAQHPSPHRDMSPSLPHSPSHSSSSRHSNNGSPSLPLTQGNENREEEELCQILPHDLAERELARYAITTVYKYCPL